MSKTKPSICLYFSLTLFLSFQASGAGSVSAEEQEAEGEAPPVSVLGPDILGESGQPAGH